MTQILKQSTAVDVLIGPFLDITDAATAETGETPTVKLSKNGQALAAKNDVTVPVSDADGYYNCEFDATDTTTVGTLVLTVAASATALPIRHEYQVVEEAIYDAFYGAAATGFDANGRVDLGSWLGNAVTASAGNPDVNVETLDDIDLSTTMKASVNAEVLDVLSTDTFAEPTGVPGATVSLAQKIGYLYMGFRNKITVTATKKTYFDDTDAAEFEKDLTDDATTYTESEANVI